MTHEDIEWLDDEDVTGRREDEELAAGSRRLPLRRRTRLGLAGLGVAVVGAAVVVGITTGTKGRPQAAPTTRTVAPIRSSERTFAVELPGRAPRAALAAIREALPTADLTSFSAASGDESQPGLYLAYNLRAGRRLVTITVGPPRTGQPDAVLRTATSIQIGQLLGKQRVDVLLRTERGAPTAKDFAAVQQLVLDSRLLATK